MAAEKKNTIFGAARKFFGTSYLDQRQLFL